MYLLPAIVTAAFYCWCFAQQEWLRELVNDEEEGAVAMVAVVVVVVVSLIGGAIWPVSLLGYVIAQAMLWLMRKS